MQPRRWLVFLAGALLLGGGAARAQASYTLQPLIHSGDRAGDVTISPDVSISNLTAIGLNDSGEVVFFGQDATTAGVLVDIAGGRFTTIAREGGLVGDVRVQTLNTAHGPTSRGHTLVIGTDANGQPFLAQYAAGRATLIAAAGHPAPGGTWAQPFSLSRPVSMNYQGLLVFAAPVAGGGATRFGIYAFNPAAQQVKPVAVAGQLTPAKQTIVSVSPLAPAVNYFGSVVFAGEIQDAAGTHTTGLFFMDASGNVRPVLLTGQRLPDGLSIATQGLITSVQLNAVGSVLFSARRADATDSYYLWEKGTGMIRGPVAAIGQSVPDGGQVARIDQVILYPFTPEVLLYVRLNDPSSPNGIYRWSGGALQPLVRSNQPAPGGGVFADALPGTYRTASLSAIQAMYIVFRIFLGLEPDGGDVGNYSATLSYVTLDNETGLARMDWRGKLTPVLQSGTTSSLGPLALVEPGVINSQGQIALSLWTGTSQFDVRDNLVLLTPTTP